MRQPRYLTSTIREDALAARKMAFISGPRQVGKTTLAKGLLENASNYFTWDDPQFRKAWSKDSITSVQSRGAGLIVLDEIHKDRAWKGRLKGLYDLRGEQTPIVVTGSARLDLYRRGGESLLGRYIPYRLHPFSVGEDKAPPGPDQVLERHRVIYPWDDLLRLGGFPEPLLGGSEARARRWSRLRMERLIQEDLRDLRTVENLQALQVLVDLLPERVGSLLSVRSLQEDVGVAYATVRAWLLALEALYVSFRIRPYARRLKRALKAEPKLYLFDPLQLPTEALGQRRENLVALHLIKAAQFWTDSAQGDFELRFVRDKEQREVDFLMLRDKKPWLMVECKSNAQTPSANLLYFARVLEPAHRVQLVNAPSVDRWLPEHRVRLLSYEKFLSGLV